ncbi:hypothetical protein [Spirulina subsalsa]|uniref:hypothetical protein n=1 Tax=Spirulina subsalsa TaxID=54311 RepID=UPI0002F18A88|nr:hypothetical protein [Spirulina subsalsa]
MIDEPIYAPNIYLFAFQNAKFIVSDNRGELVDPKWIYKTSETILNQFHLDINEIHFELKSGNFPPTRIHLLDNNEQKSSLPIDLSVPLEHEGQNSLKGRIYPLWIEDSYALGLNIRYPQGEGVDAVAIDDLKNFNPASCFARQTISSNLGQTVLITGFLNQEQQRKKTKELRKLADECYRIFTGLNQSVSPPQELPFYKTGKLFGSPIFEYGVPCHEDPNGHILIWFFFSESTSENFIDCYQQFTDIFCYRNKVIKAYENSQLDYQQGIQICKDLEQDIAEIKNFSNDATLREQELQNLKLKLKHLLKTALDYSQILRNLEYNYNSIKINMENYQEKLSEVVQRLQKLGHWRNADLVFLEEFYQQDCPKYQAQIQANLFYLRHGLQLLDQAIATIRGITEIDQAERDRTLHTLILVIGVGVGTGVIFAQNFSHPETPTDDNPPTPPALQTFSYSLGVGLSFALLTYLCRRFWKNR